MRVQGWCRLACVSSVVLLWLGCCGVALGASGVGVGWWHIGVGVRPSNVGVGKAASEVQRLTVSATGGSVVVTEPGFSYAAFLAGDESLGKVVEFSYDASHQVVQKELEEIYGHGNILVSGGPGDEAGLHPYTITFTGALTDTPEELVNTELTEVFKKLRNEPGLMATADVAQLAEGVSAGELVLHVTNIGNAGIDGAGSPVVVSDKLPAGLVASRVTGAVFGPYFKGGAPNAGLHGNVKCTVLPVRCTVEEEIPAFDTIEVQVFVNSSEYDVEPTLTEDNLARVSGGGVGSGEAASVVPVGGGAVSFGVESFGVQPEEEGGGADLHAASHPFQVTTALALNETGSGSLQPAQPRDLQVRLPRGLVGNATAVPQCTLAQFATVLTGGSDLCPADSAVGVAVVNYLYSANTTSTTPPFLPATNVAPVPVFNLTPEMGEPARFGFIAARVPVVLDSSVRSGEGYGVSVTVSNTPQSISFLSSLVTIWGVPGSSAHNATRGWTCLSLEASCAAEVGAPRPFLTLPGSCDDEPLESQLLVNTWDDAVFGEPAGFTGQMLEACNQLPSFAPQIQVSADTQAAASATGLTVHLRVPQEASEEPFEPAEADVKSTTVSLPAGLTLNPSAAAGLGACSESEIGYQPTASENTSFPESGYPAFSEETEAERTGKEPHRTECPGDAKLGSVTIKTPLLPEPLEGAVYQATQNQNPFGALLALYLIAEDKQAGVRVRIPGEVKVLSGGQLVSRFPQTPQLPFEEITLKFFGGVQAPLATSGCGEYQTTSLIQSWADSEEPATPSSIFAVQSGPGGSACSSLNGFTPSFAAGSIDNAAAAYSPLRFVLDRKDGEQNFSTVATTLPPGLAGMISNVMPCPEPQAAQGTCSANSQIGHVRVSAGVGSQPISIPQPGKPEDPVYLTGPYDGAPYGLSIAVRAEAGPFNLDENNQPVIVRATINVNPITTQVSIQSRPMPAELQNIPLQIRAIEVLINKPNFAFNPTNCTLQTIAATIVSNQGAGHTTSVPYQAADCASLPFNPTLIATSQAKHTHRYGAYLRVNVNLGIGQANLKSVLVELPKLLPSRSETLKGACSEEQFAANPAGCPAVSRVGTAVVHTPVLPDPLTGPAVFVSHGGAAFPDLDLVLQGDGVTIEQVGSTNIIKGITSSDFKTIPDVPVNSIELTLPQGPNSALAATGNLCTQTTAKRVKAKTHGKTTFYTKRITIKRRLTMPTTIIAQNGDTIKQNTIIQIAGCNNKKRQNSHIK